MFTQIPLDLPDDHQLLAVATIAVDGAGEYSLSTATGVEAEAVGREPEEPRSE